MKRSGEARRITRDFAVAFSAAPNRQEGYVAMETVILVGVQGAGKSTFYREKFFDTHVRINLDMLKTRRREELLVAACLEAGQSFVVDNTNARASDRAKYVQSAHAIGFRAVAYFFEVPLRDAMQRNSQRKLKEKIPAVAVAATHKKLEPPTKNEGFDQIFTVRVNNDGGFVVTEDA